MWHSPLLFICECIGRVFHTIFGFGFYSFLLAVGTHRRDASQNPQLFDISRVLSGFDTLLEKQEWGPTSLLACLTELGTVKRV